jgi:hypothetical protein
MKFPLAPAVEAEAKTGIFSLYCSDQWKPKSECFGHSCMTQNMKKEPMLRKRIDMILKHVSDKSFTIRFPDRSEWKHRLRINRNGGLIWYTDGSKMNKGTGAGLYG